jgi:hypothetical protein
MYVTIPLKEGDVSVRKCSMAPCIFLRQQFFGKTVAGAFRNRNNQKKGNEKTILLLFFQQITEDLNEIFCYI